MRSSTVLDLPIIPVRSPDVEFHPIEPPVIRQSENLYFIQKPWLVLNRTKRREDQDPFYAVIESGLSRISDVITVARCETEEYARLIAHLLNEDFYRKLREEKKKATRQVPYKGL